MNTHRFKIQSITLECPELLEEWRNIPGSAGYQVSNLGRMRTVDREYTYKRYGKIIKAKLKGKICGSWVSTKGYLMVSVFDKGFPIHRLVAKTFIPNRKNKPQVNHINGVKSDNRVENLEWCTNQENCLHAHKTGLNKNEFGEKGRNARLSDVQIKEIISLRRKGISNPKIARKYGITASYTWTITTGKSNRGKNVEYSQI